MSEQVGDRPNKIPDGILIDILGVYEFGKEENLKKMPSDLICERRGGLWTTWKRIFQIRKRNKQIRAEKLK